MARILLFCCCILAVVLAIRPAAAQVSKADSGQEAVIVFANGKQVSGVLLAMGAKEVKFRATGQRIIVTHAAEDIKSVQTRGGTFVYNPQARTFERATAAKAAEPEEAPPAKKPPREPSAKDDETPPSDKVQTVIVEGVGKTSDDALKDAFRNAVREVVGAAVDAETRLKNDEIISDKILTASNGFVAGYEKIKLTEDDGLFRIKIKAKVERIELIDKLRKFKITTIAVKASKVLPEDKDQRFSDDRVKEMTKEEAQDQKTELLQDALSDLPKVLEARARVPDRFDYDDGTSTLKVQVQLGLDGDRYGQFLKRLFLRLDKISLAKGFAAFDGTPKDLNYSAEGARGFYVNSIGKLAGPDFSRQPDAWVLWILTNGFNQGAGTRWAGYFLDADVRKCVTGLHGELKVRATLLDADGNTITEEEFGLIHPQFGNLWLGTVTARRKAGAEAYGARSQSVLAPHNKPDLKVTQEQTVNVILAPIASQITWGSVPANSSMTYALKVTYPLKVKIDKAEVKRLKEIRCTVLFRPEKPSAD